MATAISLLLSSLLRNIDVGIQARSQNNASGGGGEGKLDLFVGFGRLHHTKGFT